MAVASTFYEFSVDCSVENCKSCEAFHWHDLNWDQRASGEHFFHWNILQFGDFCEREVEKVASSSPHPTLCKELIKN